MRGCSRKTSGSVIAGQQARPIDADGVDQAPLSRRLWVVDRGRRAMEAMTIDAPIAERPWSTTAAADPPPMRGRRGKRSLLFRHADTTSRTPANICRPPLFDGAGPRLPNDYFPIAPPRLLLLRIP